MHKLKYLSSAPHQGKVYKVEAKSVELLTVAVKDIMKCIPAYIAIDRDHT